MSIAVKVLSNVNDESRVMASESLSGTVCFHLDTQSGTYTVVFEARAVGAPDSAFQQVQAQKLLDGTLVTSTSVGGLYRIDASPQLIVRCRMTVSGPGVVNVYPTVSLG